MKFTKNCFFLYLYFTCSILLAQQNFSGIINYESKINNRQLDKYLTNERKNVNNKRVKKSLDKVFLNTKSIKSKLIFSDIKGIFNVIVKLDLDSEVLAQKILKTVSGGDKIYYYNENNKVYLIKDCTLGECFIFDNKYLEWELT